MLRRFVLGLCLVLVLGTALVSAERRISRAFLFPADAAPWVTPADFVQHALVARDGVAVHAFELEAPPGARTLVHFHNNRETAGARADLARTLHARGFGVLLVEYRGYGASRGPGPCEEGLYLDAESALGMLARRGLGADRIVLWGTSLGTGVAAEMARRGWGSRLVLVTPYTSIPDLVADAAPGLPAGLLVPDHFDTLAKSSAIQIPTLIIHGDADEVVPFWMGRRLADAIQGSRLLRVAGARHGDLFARDGERLLGEIVAISGRRDVY